MENNHNGSLLARSFLALMVASALSACADPLDAVEPESASAGGIPLAEAAGLESVSLTSEDIAGASEGGDDLIWAFCACTNQACRKIWVEEQFGCDLCVAIQCPTTPPLPGTPPQITGPIVHVCVLCDPPAPAAPAKGSSL